MQAVCTANRCSGDERQRINGKANPREGEERQGWREAIGGRGLTESEKKREGGKGKGRKDLLEKSGDEGELGC